MPARSARRLFRVVTSFTLLFSVRAEAQAPEALASFAEPGISPDGYEIAFVSGGDIWTVSSQGGAARLLVAHSANESRPLYSPDGRLLAFNSDRDGGLDIYVMDLASGAVSRLTYASGSEQLNGWSRDSEWVYFSSTDQDISSMSDVFRVRATGGTPMVVAGDDYETEFFAAPGPSGSLALSTRGNMARSQWWRNGHAHIDEAEIWLVREGSPPTYEPVTTGGKNLWPMWSGDGESIYFMSDRSGAENLWRTASNAGTSGGDQRLTDFTEGRLLWPSIAIDGELIAFERGFGIWTHDVRTGRTTELDIRLLGSVEGPRPELLREDDGFSGLAVSPDGDKAAFIVHGEIFAATTDGDVPAVRVTDTPASESDIAWAAGSDEIVYVSWRNGTPQIFGYDFGTGEERQITATTGRDDNPVFSPDGRYLAYNRAGRELRIIDTEDGEDRAVATGTSGSSSIAWSPDSRWIAYGGRTDEFNNAMVVSVEDGEPEQVSFLSNTNFGSLGWSSTGEYLVFRTGQRTEPGRLVRIDLVPLTPTFHEDRFWDLFNEEEREEREPAVERPAPERTASIPDVPAEVELVVEGIRRRGYSLDLDFSVGSVVLSPDGEHAVVTGQGGLYYVSMDEDDEVRRLGETNGGGAQSIQFSGDGREIYFLRGGQIRVMNIDSGNTRTISTSAELEVDFAVEKVAVFEQGWGEMRDGFYDDEYHGADWDRVKEVFRPRIAGARTRAELNRLMNLMLGELNGSHLGHRLGGGGGATQTGRLGLRFDRGAFEDDGRFLVSEVVELGPSDVAGVEVGEYVVAVAGEPVDGATNLNRRLAGTTGDKVTLTLSSDPSASGSREVEVQPIGTGAERQLVYRSWVEGRRAYVDELSGGRLGYVHIASMSQGALDQLIFDLDQENHAREGVVVDVRNNNGGFVNVYAIDILSRRNYFTMQNRGGVVAPSRVQLGQRALLAPTVLVTNQHTLSDGEDFTEGYRTLELGTVVGEPTAGWIIYTGSVRLVDGSSVRMPRTKIRDTRGQVMELNPRPVDIEVERPTGESYLGRDRQLERAVDELLRQLGVRATTSGRR
jgi:tricorn protease